MIESRKQLEEKIKELAEKPEYKFYLEARDAVLRMMENNPYKTEFASKYWQEELGGFEYIFDASPLMVNRWRHQHHHVSGLHDYDYREHHQHRNKKVMKTLTSLTAKYGRDLLVPENLQMGGFGYVMGGDVRFNGDTINFFQCLLAMNKVGLLDGFKNNSERKIVLEIGSGWGGLTYQFKTLFPNTTYVMVDLPPTMLFSITYLRGLFPNAKTFVADGSRESIEKLNSLDFKEYDFVFAPHYIWSSLNFKHPDLLINRASFQEMKAEEAEDYIKKAKEWGIPAVYSMNRDRSPHNPEMTSVGDIFRKYYSVEEIILDDAPSFSLFRRLKRKIFELVNGKKGLPSINVHRHLVGRL